MTRGCRARWLLLSLSGLLLVAGARSAVAGPPVACTEGAVLPMDHDVSADCAFETTDDIDDFQFEGVSGTEARVLVKAISGLGGHPLVEIRDPDGVLLHAGLCAAQDGCESGTFSVLPTATLPKTGTYAVSISENGQDNTGTYEVTLVCLFGACDSDGVPPPDAAPPRIAAATHALGFDRWTDHDTLEFEGTAGTEVRVNVKATGGLNGHPLVEIRDPDGVLLHDGGCSAQNGCETGMFSEVPTPTLPKTGLYRLTIAENGLDNTGSYEVTLGCLFGACDQDADGVLDEVDNCLEVANPDQTDSDGDGFGNRCDGDFNDDGIVGVPDFAGFGVHFGCDVVDACYDAQYDLNSDGIIGVPDFGLFGALFGGEPGPAGIGLLEYDESLSLDFDEWTDIDALQFEGTAGTEVRIHVRATGGLNGHPVVQVRDPDGVLLHDGACAGQDGCESGTFSELATPTLSKTGSYRVTLSESGLDNTGTYEVTLVCLFGACDSDGVPPADPDPPLISHDETVALDFDHRTESDALEFEGTAGTEVRVNVRALVGLNGHPLVEIRDPDGVLLHDGLCAGQDGCESGTFSELPTATLPKTGVYRLTLSEFGLDNTGTYEVTLTCLFGACDSDGVPPPDPPPPPIIYGETVSLDFDQFTDHDALEFAGAATTEIRITVFATGGLNGHPVVEVRDPDGVVLHDGVCSGGCESSTFSLVPSPTLTKTGTYRLVFGENGLNNTGSYDVILECLAGSCP